MSDNFKIQILKIIVAEKFRQTLKVSYFCYIICERQLGDTSGRFPCHLNEDRPIFGALSKPRYLSLVFAYKHNQKISKIKIGNKKSTFWLMEKHIWFNFHILKNGYHRVFIQFSVCMEMYENVWQEVSHIWKLYDKKFWSNRVDTESNFSKIFFLQNTTYQVLIGYIISDPLHDFSCWSC